MLLYRNSWRWPTTKQKQVSRFPILRSMLGFLLTMTRKLGSIYRLQLALILLMMLCISLPVVGLLWITSRIHRMAVRRLVTALSRKEGSPPSALLFEWQSTCASGREAILLEFQDPNTDPKSLQHLLKSCLIKDARFKMALMSKFGCHVWKIPKAGFKFDDHFNNEKSDNGREMSENNLLAKISDSLNQPFPEDKSPWQVDIMRLQKQSQGNLPTYIAVFMVHPLLSSSLVRCLQSTTVKFACSKIKSSSKPGKIDWAKLLYRLETISRNVYKLMNLLASVPDYVRHELYPCLLRKRALPPTLPGGSTDSHLKVSERVQIARSREISMETFRQMQIKLGCKLDTVMFSCIAGALRRYYLHTRGDCPSRILCGHERSPVSTETVDLALGNADPRSRIRYLLNRENIDVSRQLRRQYLSDKMLWLVSKIFAPAVSSRLRFFLFRKYDAKIAQIQMDGRTLLNEKNAVGMLHAWKVPENTAGLALTLIRFDGNLVLDISALRSVISRPDLLASAFIQDVQDLALALGVRIGRRNTLTSPISALLPSPVRQMSNDREYKRSTSETFVHPSERLGTALSEQLGTAQDLFRNTKIGVIHRRLANAVFLTP